MVKFFLVYYKCEKHLTVDDIVFNIIAFELCK